MNSSTELRKTITFIEYIPITMQSQSWQVVSEQLPVHLMAVYSFEILVAKIIKKNRQKAPAINRGFL
jgi:hypothetical protein